MSAMPPAMAYRAVVIERHFEPLFLAITLPPRPMPAMRLFIECHVFVPEYARRRSSVAHAEIIFLQLDSCRHAISVSNVTFRAA